MIKVETTKFGTTGQEVSTVGLGGGQYVYDGNTEKETLIDVIRYAYNRGINYFDTAPFYHSEQLFGEALEKIDRSNYFLATKVCRYREDDILKRHDLSAVRAEASVENSLRQLRTDYIDLVQIHDFDYAENSVKTVLTETLPMLDKLRQRGVIKYVGLTSYDLSKMKMIVERSPVKIDSILSHSRLTLIDQGLKDFIPFFKSKGIAVINAAPLSLGLLSSEPCPAWMNIHPELLSATKMAVTQCELSRYYIERLANAYSFSQGQLAGVDVMLTGPASRRILSLNLRSYFEGLTKSENFMSQILVDEIFSKLSPEVRDINSIANKTHFVNVSEAKRNLLKVANNNVS